jgi:hypothetical protein
MITFDEEIKIAGNVVEVIRTNTPNYTTHMYYGHLGRVAGKYRANPNEIHQAGYYLPTDSGVESGELLYDGTSYYLVASIIPVIMYGTVACYRGMLYMCNQTISIYAYNSTTKMQDSLVSENIPCLITQGRNFGAGDDKSLMIDEYKGKQFPFDLYLQESSGLTRECRIITADGNKFKVQNDFDIFYSGGLIKTQILWSKN